MIQWKMPTVTSGLCACVRSIPCRGCLVRYPLLIVNQSWLNNLTKHIGHASAWCSQCVLKVALHPSNLSPAKARETRCQTITQASTTSASTSFQFFGVTSADLGWITILNDYCRRGQSKATSPSTKSQNMTTNDLLISSDPIPSTHQHQRLNSTNSISEDWSCSED